MASAEPTTSSRSIRRHSPCRAAAGSMPLARASTRVRSRRLTMIWSRTAGASSRSAAIATTKTMNPAIAEYRSSSCQLALFRVWLVTTVTTRLPTTGPIVQYPIAVARPSCGEKSLISAGVATSTMPSIKLTSANSTRYVVLPPALGRPKKTSTEAISSP